MSCAWERRESAIAKAIRKSIPRHTHPTRGHWGFESPHAGCAGASGILDDDWFLVETAWPCDAKSSPEDLLRAQEGLTGLAKLADPDHGRSACVRAEIPVGEGIPLVARLGGTLTAIFAAQRPVAQHSAPRGSTAATPHFPDPAGSQALARMLAETRWPHHGRDDASIAVDLESDRDHRQARLAISQNGHFSASVEMADWRSPSGPSRAAGARMLLCANHATRMARAAVQEEGDRWVYRFEVRLESSPSERELHHVLATLSVAGRRWTRELRALEEESIARAYLAARAGGVEHPIEHPVEHPFEHPAMPEHQPQGR